MMAIYFIRTPSFSAWDTLEDCAAESQLQKAPDEVKLFAEWKPKAAANDQIRDGDGVDSRSAVVRGEGAS